MIHFKFVMFPVVVYVSHKVNVFVTDLILKIMSQEHLIFTSLHIGSRLFELFSKEVRVKKQPGMPLKRKNSEEKDGGVLSWLCPAICDTLYKVSTHIQCPVFIHTCAS